MVDTKNKAKFTRDVEKLLEMAYEVYKDDPKLADRYAYIAYRIILSKKLRLPKNKKVLICRNCTKILIPGKTASLRIYKNFITYKCLNCGSVRKLRI
jgi:ribonuclease P protein subunit RPR2